MDIAIIGMAGRFPGARNVDALWANLTQGRDVRRALPAAAPPRSVPRDAKAVRTAYVLEDVDRFDAAFFEMTPREASITDPQHRILLECAYEALEDAGHVDERAGTIGVFASANFNTYLFHVAKRVDDAEIAKHLEIVIGNDKDYLATRISYKLGLTGPSMTVQTACSSSLVAVCQAVQALQSVQCDLALVGGVGVRALQETGYLVRPGEGVLSEDGRTRPFDARGSGFVEGHGAGVVVLRRLTDALAHGDAIRAVIRGWAVNNDGSSKIGFTAPSVTGQSQVIEEAVAMAGVDPATISYVEAHGTGTPLGDPIEVEALGRSYGRRAGARCRLGSIKADIGHLDAAAGVAGLIKAVLCLEHGYLPGILDFEQPNPRARLAELGFEASARGEPWPRRGDAPRRAAVSSLGIGGTNAHVVLEEAPAVVRQQADTCPQLLVVSARSPQACEQSARRLAERLAQGDAPSLPDVAHTLRVGRRPFQVRRCVVASSTREAAQALVDSARFLEGERVDGGRSKNLAFLFPGAGKQYAGMGGALYRGEPTYREVVDACARHARELAGLDLHTLLFEQASGRSAWLERERTGNGFLALFTTEVALARLWSKRGFAPRCAIGHSVGEYAAAHLAGVFSLRRAIELLWERGRVFEHLPEGGMLALQLPEQEVCGALSGSLSLAAVNGPRACVVSGAKGEVDALEKAMRARGVPLQRLAVAVPGHSPLLMPHVAAFRACLAREPLRAPELPFISSMHGAWISAAEATDPEYWVRQLLSPVRFGMAIDVLLEDPACAVVQLGPGGGLLNSLRERMREGQIAISGLPDPDGPEDSHRFSLEAMGRAWLAGVEVDFDSEAWTRGARRVSLPTYPFERERHWIELTADAATPATGALQEGPRGWVPTWKRGAPRRFDRERIGALRWWVVAPDRLGWAATVIAELRELGAEVKEVRPCSRDRESSVLTPAAWQALFTGTPPEQWPDIVLHPGTLLDAATEGACERAWVHDGGLLALAQGLSESELSRPFKLVLLTSGLLRVFGGERITPLEALPLGLLRTLPHELPQLDGLHVDVGADERITREGARALLAELASSERPTHVPSLALRAGELWQAEFEPLEHPEEPSVAPLKPHGVYLILGGFGGIGATLARAMAEACCGLRMALLSRPRAASGGESPAQRTQLLADLRALGAEVRAYEADVSDEARMREVVSDLLGWGELRGVVHAAGVIGGGLLELGGAAAGGNLSAKVDGLLLLDRLVSIEALDFVVLCSSLGAYTGAFGQADSTAANVFFDAFAQAKAGEARRLGRRINVHAIGWDYWLDVGMLKPLAATHRAIAGRDFSVGLRASEGGPWLWRALAAGSPQLLVSVRDFPGLLGETKRTRGAARAQFEQAKRQRAESNRPPLATRYVAPRSALEACLCGLWEQALGVHPVGVRDDFRELGGQSLTALPLVARIRETLRISLSLRDFFASGHVAALAELVREAEGPSGTATLIAEALQVARRMTQDDAARSVESEAR